MSNSAMRRVSRRNLGAHKVRLVLTVVSVVLGTAFIAGSFVFTDTLKSSFDKVFASSYQHVDVRVDSRNDRSSGVPTDLVPRLRQVPGVERVQVEANGAVVLLGSDGKRVSSGGAPSTGSVWYPPDQQLGSALTLTAGTAPDGSGQVAINSGAADRGRLGVGAHTRVLTTSAGLVDVTITGIYQQESDVGGYIGVLFAPQQALQLFTDGRHVDSVDIVGAGVGQSALRDRIAPVLPADLQAKTGEQARADQKSDVEKTLSFINYFLLAFGFVALIVGTFIIYNTFSMIVAQRTRELALLRAIGADRRQVRRSVLYEAGVIGAVGSLLGVAAGIGLAYGLRALLDATGSGLPAGALTLAPRTVIVGVAVGVIVTLISANAPSRRAATTPPVAAMRQEFASTGTSLRRRTAFGAAFTALGAVATVLGAVSGSGGSAAASTGLGLLAVGAGAMLLSPVLSRWVIGGLGRVVGRPFGPTGRLARTNAIRNPRRTAATAFALTLGLLLVSAIAVVGASTKRSLDATVDNGVTADYLLTTSTIPLPLAAAEAASSVPGIGSFVQLHFLQTTVDGADTGGEAVDGNLYDVGRLTITAGSGQLGPTTMLVSKKAATDHGWQVDDTVRLTQPGGASVALRVGGIYANTQLFTTWIVPGNVYRQLTPRNAWADEVALVKAAAGTDLATLRAGLERATDPFYVVDVQDREQFKGSIASQVDSLLGILYALLGLAIIIAILGIVNTLALSVVERRRELGMLRAVGMARGQVRRTIYLESFLIAVFGAVLGLGLGLTYGTLFTRTLREQGLSHIAVPWGQAALFLVLAAVVGVLAALWPAARAARTRPLEAIAGQ